MSKPAANLATLTECPLCQAQDGYYVRLVVTGTVQERHTFDGSEANNTHLHDSLRYTRQNEYAYCVACDQIIARG